MYAALLYAALLYAALLYALLLYDTFLFAALLVLKHVFNTNNAAYSYVSFEEDLNKLSK